MVSHDAHITTYLKRTHRCGHNVPCLAPLKTFYVDEDALHFDDSQGWVRVVELDGNLVGELLPRTLGLLETTHNVVERSSHPEVLLLQTQLLASLEVVVGVQHSADGLSTLLVGDRAFVVTTIELLKVEFAVRSLAGPETEVVGSRCIVTRNWDVVGDSANNLTTLPVGDGFALGVCLLANVAEELDLYRH